MKINFDALLTLLFLVVFFVLPLLSRVMRGRGRPPTTRPGGAPQRPGGPPTQGTGAPGERPTGPVAGGDQDTPAWLREAQRRVRDAQAGGRTSAGAPSGTSSGTPSGTRSGTPSGTPSGTLLGPRQGTLVPEDPFGRGLMERPEASRPGGLGREGGGPAAGRVPRPAAPPAGPHAHDSLGREGLPPRGRRAAASAGWTAASVRRAPAASHRGSPYALRAVRTRPLGDRRGAKMGAGDLLRFDRRSIVRGLIWHEILDEPASKRRYGRKPSRPRSR